MMFEVYIFLFLWTQTVSYESQVSDNQLHLQVNRCPKRIRNDRNRTPMSENRKVKWPLPLKIHNLPANEEKRSTLNSIPYHRFRRKAEESRSSVTVTCDLFLRSDQFLWNYVKNRHYFEQSDSETKLEIKNIFQRNVDFLNRVYGTEISTYDNRIRYNGIKFAIAKTQILSECSRDEYSYCDPSLSQVSLVQRLANYTTPHCITYLFTYRDWGNFQSDALAFTDGACRPRYNTGFVNMRTRERQVPVRFAHEVGHLLGSPHDRGSTCFNNERDRVKGNYLMSSISLGLGEEVKERTTQLSPCSKDNISRYLDDVIHERRHFNNCLHVEVQTNVEEERLTDEPVESDRSHWWVVGVASVSLLVCVSLALALPFVLWRKRVTFIMKLIYRFKMYEDNDTREFDAFISYKSTESDEHFVVHTLFPKLEKELGFKICVHFRDFVPGETISNNIIWAVENSRRTILVLSPSYVQSEFCQFEYQKAQHEMLKQKQRIIPIVYQDISQVKGQMDPTLRAILNSITYIEWPHTSEQSKVDKFWEMLKLSMPKLSGTRTSLCVVNENMPAGEDSLNSPRRLTDCNQL